MHEDWGDQNMNDRAIDVRRQYRRVPIVGNGVETSEAYKIVRPAKPIRHSAYGFVDAQAERGRVFSSEFKVRPTR